MDERRPRALVTGGTSRLGRAICQALHRADFDIHFTWRTDEAHAKKLALDLGHGPDPRFAPPEESRRLWPPVSGHQGQGWDPDSWIVPAEESRLLLDDPDSLVNLANRISHRPLDVLVHNAAMYRSTPIESLTHAKALDHVRVNALAPLILTQRLAPVLARSTMPGGGAVVCLSDIHAGDRPRRGYTAYLMSKAALEQMVRCLALELAPKVRVNAVALGVAAFPDEGEESTPEFQQRYVARVPLGRAGTPREAAEAVRWLALDATYMTGQVIRVDGGRSVG